MTHCLKIWPGEYKAIYDNLKKFEIRVNDRNFNVGDKLVLQMYDPDKEEYMGKELEVRITCIYQGMFGLPGRLCVMGIEHIIPN